MADVKLAKIADRRGGRDDHRCRLLCGDPFGGISTECATVTIPRAHATKTLQATQRGAKSHGQGYSNAGLPVRLRQAKISILRLMLIALTALSLREGRAADLESQPAINTLAEPAIATLGTLNAPLSHLDGRVYVGGRQVARAVGSSSASPGAVGGLGCMADG